MAAHDWEKSPVRWTAPTYYCVKCGLFAPAPADTECDESEVISG